MIVYILAIKNDEILLLKRQDNEQWALIGDHVEEREFLRAAAYREATEEEGIQISQKDLNPLCVINCKLRKLYRFHTFFCASNCQHKPKNQRA